MVFGLLTFLFLLVCVILVFLVLVQDDKGGGISGAIGGGIGSNVNSLVGSQNADKILTRGTKIFAAVFFGLTIVITLWVAKGNVAQSASGAKKIAERENAVLFDAALPQQENADEFIPQQEFTPLTTE
ncbi:MAG: preprotein translocase subunit SecG [Chitinivibrionia bacterium]|jgi:preprotein translocase subunit SecG|nr:preprotein translocase subunit SecG [Chitinivibrionia bacterium]